MTPYKLKILNGVLKLKSFADVVLNIFGIKDLGTQTGNVDNGLVDWSIQHLTKTTAQWNADTTTILLKGQLGIEDTANATYKLKIGNGTNLWSALSYVGGGGGGSQDLQSVTDLGATTTNAINTAGITSDYLLLDTAATNTNAVGKIVWNDTLGTGEIGLKGGNINAKLAQDLYARVVNKTTQNLLRANYQAVKVQSAQGQRLAVNFAQANNDNNSADTIGIVAENINNNQEGFVITVGQIENINTTGSLQGETWEDGDVIYLSPTTAGSLTNVKPNGSTGHIIVIGYVEYAHQNNGKIYVKIMNGWELDELHNVFISSPSNNQILTYESSTQLWKNKTVNTALGYTAENTSNKSIDGTLNANSDTLYPSQKAVKTYVDGSVTGLLDDRGNYDASGNVFPSSGGSGTAGAILKGDLWYISVAGTLGGTSVVVGSSVRALVDTPDQTSTNWSILNVGLGYTPENSANKATSFSTINNTLYPSVQAVKSYIDGIVTTNYIDTRYSTKYYVPYLSGESANQRILTSNTSTHAVPFLNIFNDIITNISIEITTAVASSSVRFQIYNGDKSTLLPTTLVMDSDLIASTTTGIKTISGLSLNLTLDNLYFMVISTNTNNVGVRGVPTYLMQQYYGSLTKFLLVGRSGTGYDYMGVSSAVPSTFNISGLVDTTPTSGIFAPTLFFR
jgi:hypothetical protein